MPKHEYHEVLNKVTARKRQIEDEDARMLAKINECLTLLGHGSNPEAQQEMDRCKRRRFPELYDERRELCEGYIREKTGFTGNVIQIYQRAEEANLKGEQWARFMLDQCGWSEPN